MVAIGEGAIGEYVGTDDKLQFSDSTLALFAQLLSTAPLNNADLGNEQFEDALTQIVTARRELRDVLAAKAIT